MSSTAEFAEAFAEDGADARPTVRTALAVLAAAVLAAAIVPGSRVGLGLSAASMGLLVAAAVDSNVIGSRWRIALLVAAELLLLAPLLRDFVWVVGIDLALALALASAALAGATTWRALGRAWTAFAGYAVTGGAALLPVLKAATTRIPAAGPEGYAAAARAAALTAGLLTVFAALFASADGVFAHMFEGLAPDLDIPGLIGRIIALVIAVAVGGGLALLAKRPEDDSEAMPAPAKTFGTLEWCIPLGALVILFAGFVAVQLVALFGGNDHVIETAGLTYAEYAREGFLQLLVAAGLVLALVAASLRWASADGPRERTALRILLAALCVLTLVILASALHRLDLYVDAFGATRIRFLAAACCAMVSGLLVVALVAAFTRNREWLPAAVPLIAAVIALTVTAVNPDAWVAERNVERYEAIGKIDTDYNRRLSADAIPALTELPPEFRDEALAYQRIRLSEPDGFWGFSEARRGAREAMNAAPVSATP